MSRIKADFDRTCTCTDHKAFKQSCTEKVGLGRMAELRMAKLDGSPGEDSTARRLECIAAYEHELSLRKLNAAKPRYACGNALPAHSH